MTQKKARSDTYFSNITGVTMKLEAATPDMVNDKHTPTPRIHVTSPGIPSDRQPGGEEEVEEWWRQDVQQLLC